MGFTVGGLLNCNQRSILVIDSNELDIITLMNDYIEPVIITTFTTFINNNNNYNKFKANGAEFTLKEL